jgi:hypothetical protein
MRKRALPVVAVVATLAVALGACSSDDDSDSASTTSPSDKAEVCAARDQLRESVRSLTDDASSGADRDAIDSALDDVRRDLDDLGDTARETYRPQVDDVQSALDDLRAAVGSLDDGGSIAGNFQDLANAAADLGSASSALVRELAADCPSG